MLIYSHQVKAITAKIRHRAYAILSLNNAKKMLKNLDTQQVFHR